MTKTAKKLILVIFLVLMTVTFCFAEYAATGVREFPYFQLGCLIVGGITIFSLKYKYHKIYVVELVGVFALYTMLIALFTSPVINLVKTMVS